MRRAFGWIAAFVGIVVLGWMFGAGAAAVKPALKPKILRDTLTARAEAY